MSHVRIVGGATPPFAKRSDSDVGSLAAQAAVTALSASEVSPQDIDEVYVASVYGGSLVGQRAMRYAGLTGKPIVNVENACASGGTAVHLAARSIAQGAVRLALVVGVERLSSLGSGTLPLPESEWEARSGVAMPVLYGMRAQRYMHEYGASREDLAAVSVKSRRFAEQNPGAQFGSRLTIGDVLQSPMVADPLTLYQCCPKSDGASALILASSEFAAKHGRASVPRLRGTALTSGTFSTAARDICKPDITSRTAALAYDRAGLGPEDIDVAELHDAFSIAELIYYEELGFADYGLGVELLHSGRTSSLDPGLTPVVNPSGGLLGRGHPVGATGVAQVVECWVQLLGEAGARQRRGARAALAHVTGGGASGFDNGACAVCILTRD